MAAFRGGVTVNYTNRTRGRRRTPYLRISAGPLRGKYVHELVAEAMLGRPLNPDTEEVDHLDGNGLNPSYTNLEVVTPVENKRRAIARRKQRRNQRDRVRRQEKRDREVENCGQARIVSMGGTSFDPATFS